MNSSQSLDKSDFRSLIDYLDGIAIWIVSDPREFDYVSSGAEDIWGIPAEVLQEDPSRLIEAIHPEDRDRIRSEMVTASDQIKRKKYESRSLHPDGTVRWVLTQQIPVRDDGGELRHIVGICTDITEQKEREQELDALNRILRHDIRNDMNIIVGWGELLEEYLDEGGKEPLEKVLSAANNVIDLTKVAREYAEAVVHDSDMDVKPVPLSPILQDEIDLRKEMFPHAEFHLPDEIPQVEVKANEMLSSLFRNLLNNAVQHNDKDEPVVEIEVESLSDEVIVRIADNGPGIPTEIKASLFEEGEKSISSSGTGMGLAIVETLVEQYNGEIEVTENNPTGTVVHIHLPKIG